MDHVMLIHPVAGMVHTHTHTHTHTHAHTQLRIKTSTTPVPSVNPLVTWMVNEHAHIYTRTDSSALKAQPGAGVQARMVDLKIGEQEPCHLMDEQAEAQQRQPPGEGPHQLPCPTDVVSDGERGHQLAQGKCLFHGAGGGGLNTLDAANEIAQVVAKECLVPENSAGQSGRGVV